MKLQYWNHYTEDCDRLTLTWDVLKCLSAAKMMKLLMININMRCIEMQKKAKSNLMWLRLTLTWDVLKSCRLPKGTKERIRLTLTWDVLKFHAIVKAVHIYMININMRCIEIFLHLFPFPLNLLININMRCIEICL